MMENELEKESTYVLFGSEAIRIYKMSLKLLLSSTHIAYKVGAYTDVKKFVSETQNWDGFLEVNEDDYLQLKKDSIHKLEIKNSRLKKNKKSSIFKFFKK